MPDTSRDWRLLLSAVVSATIAWSACGTDAITDPTCATDPSLCPPSAPDTTALYLSNLPSWQSFAQPDSIPRNDLDVAADTLPIEEHFVDSVPVFGTSGIDSILTNVRYVCQSKPFTISDTPDEIVMYDPNRSILYAGALLQGKSHKEGLGSLLGLSIAERNPVRISIPDLPTGSNFREVTPNQSEVESARGEMIGNAVLNDLATPSSANFEMSSYHSERSFAIGAKLSAKYLRFEATASGSFARDVSETTVTAHYTEKMYTVVVEPPTSGFFSPDFTNQILASHVTAGRIGPDNLPVYVSEIVYGRSMMFSMTSSASESDIRSTLQASYDGLVGGGSLSLTQRQTAVLQNSRIAITSLGGSSEATAAMIQSGDWSQYFTSTAALSQAVPLSYTFTNVGDGSIAEVTEATNYTITTCTPKPVVPGVFDFNPQQQLSVPLSPGYGTYYGDLNNDGRGDMVFNYRSGPTNDVVVALGQSDGSFAVQPVQADTAAPPEGWSLYTSVEIGDVNNDGNDDVLWNRKADTNVVYVALSNGDGTFQWGGRQEHPAMGGWAPYRTMLADVDNANGADVLWNVATGGNNRLWVGLSRGDGTFDLSVPFQTQVGTCCWSGTRTHVGDVNGDGFLDMIYNRPNSSDNATWVAIGRGDGTFDTSDNAFTNYNARGWADYKTLVGDINADQRTDLFFIADRRTDIPIHRSVARADGRFDRLPWQHIPDSADQTGPFEVRMGDIDADGDHDIILVDLDGTNNRPVNTNQAKIWVGLGTDDQAGSRFDFTPVEQIHPSQDTWNQYVVHVMDVNGDRKADIVLHWNTSPHRIYVALAK